MQKRGRIIAFAILSVTLMLLFRVNANSSKIHPSIIKALEKTEEINVTVSFNAGKDSNTFKSESKDKKQIERELKKDFNVRYVAKTFNSVSLTVNKKEVERLNNLDYVKEVRIEPKVSLFLQDSVVIVNATRTWSLQVSDINLTGIGQTVCIIDSGINYSHPDLGNCTTQQFLSGNCSKVIGGYSFYNPVNTSNSNDVMGDNDHGTHIAGIIAANGSIKGIAPDAKIVAIKSCGPSSLCGSNAIVDGINWCVGNSSVYNITVISMSLGTDALFSSYCDSNWPELTTAVNSAIAKNISIVAATGNSGNTTSISNPACLSNATSVSATDKSDNVWSLSNRNSITDLFAPGVNINSTALSGHVSQQGTSMATPHVSGAILLMRQFLNLTNQVKTSKQIETALNNTGKTISDSSSNLNFSRINIYNAITSLDITSPNVTLLSPSNNKVSLNQAQTFNCNASDIALKNATFYLWNSSSNIINLTSKSILGQDYSYQVNITNISLGNYKWNCLFVDENNNGVFASSNFSLVIGGISTTLISPQNNNHTNINQSNFSCQSASEQTSSLKNVTFYLWNSTAQIYNESKNISGIDNTTNFNYTFSYNENYKWNCLSFNNNSNSSFADQNFSIVLDTTMPNITLFIPIDTYSATGSSTISFEFNVTDNLNISSCDLVLNNIALATNSSITLNISNYISYSVSPGSYTWGINCTDLAGNVGNSSSRTLTINVPAVSSTGRGGGNAGGIGTTSQVFTPKTEELSLGWKKELKKSDKIIFTIQQTENHTINIIEVTNISINLTIQSNLTRLTLYIGQNKTINLNSDHSLYLKLENILNKKANLTIKIIKNLITNNGDGQTINKTDAQRNVSLFEENQTEKRQTTQTKNANVTHIIIALFTIFILTIVIVFLRIFIFHKKKKRVSPQSGRLRSEKLRSVSEKDFNL